MILLKRPARPLVPYALLLVLLVPGPRLEAQSSSEAPVEHQHLGAAAPLRVGWYEWEPYFESEMVAGTERPTGLDIEIVRAVFTLAGIETRFVHGTWTGILEGLREGTIDVALGAIKTEERESFAHFSIPYRTDETYLYIPRQARYALGTHTRPDELLESWREQGLRLGVGDGYAYPSAALNAFIADPRNGGIVRAADDGELLDLLLIGEIDGFVSNRLVAKTLAWKQKAQTRIHEYPLSFGIEGAHLMFSRATVDEETVRTVDDAIVELTTSAGYGQIVRQYLFPVLLSMTVAKPWFFLVEVIGTIAFALSGLILARRERYAILGALVLAGLPAMGGGIVRDLIVGRTPVWIFRSPVFTFIVVGTVIIGFMAGRLRSAMKRRGLPSFTSRAPAHVLEICDALGLSAFLVTGVLVAVEVGVEPLWLWGPVLAVITGAGGGIIRDAIRSDKNPTLTGAFYAEVALIWGLFLSLFVMFTASNPSPDHLFVAVVVSMTGAFITRMAAVRFKITSPIF